jgi:hypothetical protein
MEEIEATRVALDSRLVSAYKLRCRSFSCLAKIAHSEKNLKVRTRQRLGIKCDSAFLQWHPSASVLTCLAQRGTESTGVTSGSVEKYSRKGVVMNKLLKSLLQTGLYFLEQPDRATEAARERVKEDISEVAEKFRGQDHTLRYVLTFAAGVGVGLGVGMLTAPASGEDSRSALAGKVREVGDRVKKHVSGESGLSGT